MKKKVLSFALALSMMLGAGTLLPENAFIESTSISASASLKCKLRGYHDFELVKEREATCEGNGYRKYKCKDCDEIEEEYTYPLGHFYGKWEVVIEPTCSHDGEQVRRCVHDGCICLIVENIKTKGHQYDKETVDATCTVGKYRRYICTVCGDKKIEYLSDPLGHDWGEWTTVNAATCQHGGVEVQTCSRCKATERRSISKLGHRWTEWEFTKTVSCDEEGVRERHCENCGKKETQTFPAAEHSMSDWVTTKEPIFFAGPNCFFIK